MFKKLIVLSLIFICACGGTPTGPTGIMELTPSSMSIIGILYGSLPSNSSFIITKSDGKPLTVRITDDADWVDISPQSATGNSIKITVSINSTDLSLGLHHANIFVESAESVNSPETLTVKYRVAAFTLWGTYDGTYEVIIGYNTQNADTSTSTLEMRFSDESYWFDSNNLPDNFCSPRGGYVLTNNLELTETNDGCNVTAKGSDNPRGTFSYRRPGDSLIITQQSSDTLKQILLKKRT